MHLLGLVDEYREDWSGTRVDRATGALSQVEKDPTATQYNCRVLGPADSLMSNQYDTFEGVKSHTDVVACRCLESARSRAGRACAAAVQRATRHATECPEGSRTWQWALDPTAAEHLVGGEVRKDDLQAHVINTLVVPGRLPSLLRPAQFRAIVFPGCRNVNRTYYDCAPEAYVTSRGNFGSGGCSLGLPAVCMKGGEEWLR
jgi:hypothetical protein